MYGRRRSQYRALGLILVVAFLTAACGSTAHPPGSEVLVGGLPESELGAEGLSTPVPDALIADESLEPVADELGASAVGQADAPAGSGGTTTPGGGTSGSSSGSGPTAATTQGSAPSQAPGGGAPGGDSQDSVPTGPGVTATTIYLGIPYCRDCAAGNAALGAEGEDPGDPRRYYQVAIDDVNARGGVLGRELEPVFHGFSANDTSVDAVAQAACETFTRDNEVLIMTFRGQVAYECAKQAGIMVLGTGNIGPTYEKFPNLFAPSLIRLERLFEITVRSMVRAGWHETDARWPTGRIGLITWDDHEYRYAMENGYLKGLRAAGLEPTDVRYVTVPHNVDGLGDASAAIASAVLRFRQQGIDHVFIGDGPAGVFAGAGLTFLFLNSAKTQGYYPRYGFNSYNVPDFPSHPQDQLVGMMAIDSRNSEPTSDEGIAPNQTRERCFALMTQEGLPVGDSQTRGVAVGACGFVWFAEAVLQQATAGTTLPHMIEAAQGLGTSYRSPSTYGVRLSPQQHDGAALFRELQFDEGCSCIKYTSKPFEP